jgi:dGTPase
VNTESQLERRHQGTGRDDQRSAFSRDRDRILYSQAFQRLAGVTQVVTPGEGFIFHSRLTHSLKVGQAALRLAEYLRAKNPNEVQAAGGLEPELAEAAGLAHDLGHPPFGHAAEEELSAAVARESQAIREKQVATILSSEYRRVARRDLKAVTEGDLARVLGIPGERTLPTLAHAAAEEFASIVAKRLARVQKDSVEGYEGNAQSFRVLTKLCAHRSEYVGLNLTRRTLRAVLKYPWAHDPSDHKKRRKYGAYNLDLDELHWVQADAVGRSLEADVMDLADDITYSVHDVTDFLRAGLIDVMAVLDQIRTNEYIERWIEYLRKRYEDSPTEANARVLSAVTSLDRSFFVAGLTLFPGEGRYRATFADKAKIDLSSSTMIGMTIRSATVREGEKGWIVGIPDDRYALLKFFQRVVWTEVIENPRLRSQQEGQRRIVAELFDHFLRAIREKRYFSLPPAIAVIAENTIANNPEEEVGLQLRFAADIVASLTDAEAVKLYQRLTGEFLGSIMDPLPSSFS